MSRLSWCIGSISSGDMVLRFLHILMWNKRLKNCLESFYKCRIPFLRQWACNSGHGGLGLWMKWSAPSLGSSPLSLSPYAFSLGAAIAFPALDNVGLDQPDVPSGLWKLNPNCESLWGGRGWMSGPWVAVGRRPFSPQETRTGVFLLRRPPFMSLDTWF